MTVTRMTNADYLRHLRAEAKANGKCATCRARPAKPGRSTCQVCVDKTESYKRKHVVKGLCGCGRSRYRGLAVCKRCRERSQAQANARRDRHILAGLCYRCDQPAAPDRSECVMHLKRAADYKRARYAARKAA